MKVRGFVVVCLLLSLLVLMLVTVPAHASDGSEEIPTFDAWLQAASGPLVSVIVGFLISLLADVWAKYETLPAGQKIFAYCFLCFVVPVGASSLRGALGYATWSFDPLIWHAIWHGALAAGLGTVVHKRKSAVMR